MLAINPDLLYDKPTHIHPEYGAVKVFVKTAAVWNGQICFSAEIMTGTDKGKMTTVEAKKLTIYQEQQ